jgi:ankyrin repeat protein
MCSVLLDRSIDTPPSSFIPNHHPHRIASHLLPHPPLLPITMLDDTPSLDPYIASEFCVACGLGDLDKVKEMTRLHPSLPSTSDYDARSPLHIAVSEQHADVVEFLLRCSANVNAIDRWYASPLQDAIRVHNDHLIQLLKANGAKPPNKYVSCATASATLFGHRFCRRTIM